MSTAALFGLVTVDDSNKAITLNTAGEIAEGDFYVWSPDADVSFLDELCSVLSSLKGSDVTYAINAATGQVTLASDSTFAVTFTSPMHLWLGFTSTGLSGSDSYTSTNGMLYSWLPGSLVTEADCPSTSQGVRASISTQAVAVDQTTHTLKYGEQVKNTLRWRYLTNAKTWDASDDNSSLEEMWISTLSTGRQFLYVPDYGVSDTAWPYVADLTESKTFIPKRSIPGSDAFWSYDLVAHGVNDV